MCCYIQPRNKRGRKEGRRAVCGGGGGSAIWRKILFPTRPSRKRVNNSWHGNATCPTGTRRRSIDRPGSGPDATVRGRTCHWTPYTPPPPLPPLIAARRERERVRERTPINSTALCASRLISYLSAAARRDARARARALPRADRDIARDEPDKQASP